MYGRYGDIPVEVLTMVKASKTQLSGGTFSTIRGRSAETPVRAAPPAPAVFTCVFTCGLNSYAMLVGRTV